MHCEPRFWLVQVAPVFGMAEMELYGAASGLGDYNCTSSMWPRLGAPYLRIYAKYRVHYLEGRTVPALDPTKLRKLEQLLHNH